MRAALCVRTAARLPPLYAECKPRDAGVFVQILTSKYPPRRLSLHPLPWFSHSPIPIPGILLHPLQQRGTDLPERVDRQRKQRHSSPLSDRRCQLRYYLSGDHLRLHTLLEKESPVEILPSVHPPTTTNGLISTFRKRRDPLSLASMEEYKHRPPVGRRFAFWREHPNLAFAKVVVDDRPDIERIGCANVGRCVSGNWRPRNLIRPGSVEQVRLVKPDIFGVELVLKLRIDGLPDLFYSCCHEGAAGDVRKSVTMEDPLLFLYLSTITWGRSSYGETDPRARSGDTVTGCISGHVVILFLFGNSTA